MSLSCFVCINARFISQPPASLSAGGRRSAHTAPRPRERRARASPQALFTAFQVVGLLYTGTAVRGTQG